MKRLILILAMIFSQLISYAQQAKSPATYTLDTKQSKLFWKGTKTIGKTHFGYLLFNSGWLHTDATGKLSEGMFSMNMKSIKSEEHKNDDKNKGVERELRGSGFFEVNKYPTSSITVNAIVPTPQPNQYRVEGNLKIKNTIHPIEFIAMLKHSGQQLKATATLTINRVKWGIHETSEVSATDRFFSNLKDNMIADDIPIQLNLVFNKK